MKTLLISLIISMCLPLTSGVGTVSGNSVSSESNRKSSSSLTSDLRSGNKPVSNEPSQQDSDIITIGESSKDKWIDDNVGSDYTDEGVDLPDGSHLSDTDKEQIKDWVDKIKSDDSNSKFSTMRVIRILAGIVLIVYSVVFYFAYWFDRINNIFDISLVGIMSLGKFSVSDDENISTFKNDSNGVKLVTHKDALRISLVGLMLGALLVTNLLFNFILTVYTKVRGLISRG